MTEGGAPATLSVTNKLVKRGVIDMLVLTQQGRVLRCSGRLACAAPVLNSKWGMHQGFDGMVSE